MAELTYVLAVLSHGNPGSPYAERTLASFVKHVDPLPAVTVFHHDGPGVAFTGNPPGPKVYRASPVQLGFCRATSALWADAVAAASTFQADHVFWLEHDFTFQRRVDLDALGAVLRDDTVAQVSLMRQPVNAQEKRRGRVLDGSDDGVLSEPGFLLHDRYFTTNPSLLRASFMADHPFAAGQSRLPYDIECEGRFGVELRAAGYRFAVMGDGTPWVKHIGDRTGHGY